MSCILVGELTVPVRTIIGGVERIPELVSFSEGLLDSTLAVSSTSIYVILSITEILSIWDPITYLYDAISDMSPQLGIPLFDLISLM